MQYLQVSFFLYFLFLSPSTPFFSGQNCAVAPKLVTEENLGHDNGVWGDVETEYSSISTSRSSAQSPLSDKTSLMFLL